MTSTTPVEQVAKYLEAHGYRRIKLPLVISGITFEISAALVGVEKSADLILVADTAFEKSEKILRIVKAIAKALDVARSSRPLTTVIIGPPPSSATHEALASVCRVLAIGRIDGGRAQKAFENWLAVLTPLNLPDPNSIIADPLAELEDGLEEDVGLDVAALVGVAATGSNSVKLRLNQLLQSKLERAVAAGDPSVQQDDTPSSSIVGQDVESSGDAKE